MEWFSEVVELINAVVWPLVVLGIIWIFRAETRGLLGRLIKIGKEGAEFKTPTQIPKSDEDAGLERATIKLPPTEHVAPAFRPVVVALQAKLAGDLSEAVEKTGETRENILFRVFTENYLVLHLERAYGQIFGSQIRALDYLKGRVDRKAGLDDLETIYYKTAAAAWTEMYRSITFEQWLAYLTSYELVEVKEDSVRLTDVGLALTGYIGTQGYKVDRVG